MRLPFGLPQATRQQYNKSVPVAQRQERPHDSPLEGSMNKYSAIRVAMRAYPDIPEYIPIDTGLVPSKPAYLPRRLVRVRKNQLCEIPFLPDSLKQSIGKGVSPRPFSTLDSIAIGPTHENTQFCASVRSEKIKMPSFLNVPKKVLSGPKNRKTGVPKAPVARPCTAMETRACRTARPARPRG